MKRKIRSLAVIPCLNEEVSIGLTISEIRSVVSDMEIWVVDNGSSDQTCKIANDHGARVLKCPTKGKGYAVRFAFSKIQNNYDVIFMIDGDHTYGVENLNIAINEIVQEGLALKVN